MKSFSSNTHTSRPTVALALAFATVVSSSGPAHAQTAPAASDEEDFEVPVAPAQPAPPAPAAPSPAPTPGAPTPGAPAAAPSASATTSAPPAPVAVPATTAAAPAASAPVTEEEKTLSEKSASQAIGIPTSTDPVGTTIQPRSLVAEGSNYTRPLRRGLKWWGFVQAQYQHNQISEDQLDADGQPVNENEFGLRRARLRIDQGWENAFATLELDAGTLGNAPDVRVRRAEASLLYRGDIPDDITPLVVVTAGVTDVPFGAEIGESQRDRLFMERSFGSLAIFGNEADLGVKAWGAYRYINYAVALVNGEPLGKNGFPQDPNTDKDLTGRLGVHASPLETLGVTGGVSFYTGKGFSAGKVATKDSTTWVDANNNGAVDAGEVYGVTGSAATPSQNFDRWALGLDAGLALKTGLGISRLNLEGFVASNLDRTVLPSDPVLSGADARQLSFTASLVQQLTKWGVLGVRAAYYDPNADLFEQRAGVFHLKNQNYFVLSPTAGFTLEHGRIVAQYDFVFDHLGRDDQGVPTDLQNDQLTVRLQVDL